ncbi:MAG: hypothetical protein ABI882_14415 [Acidobacteriota bacterium]
MRRVTLFLGAFMIASILAPIMLAQSDKLSGKWDGKLISPQGERPTSAVFKKEAEAYTGTVNAMSQEVPLRDIKVDGNKVTAQAQVDTGQAVVNIKYDLVLDGDALKGKGSVDFGGQTFDFDIELKRVGAGGAAADAAAPPAANTPRPQAPQQGAGAGQGRGPSVAQPTQKQSADYFVGVWTVKVIGRESPLGMAPRQGTMTFTKGADGTVSGRGVFSHEGGTLNETTTLKFDEATKMVSLVEKRSNGIELRSNGDWTSPISIRFTVEPIKAGKQALNLKRTISIISPFSFSVIEELSEDGGPFVRLSNSLYSKPAAN